MQRIEVEVTGMACGGCVRAVTRALESVEGVRRAEVSLEEARARVTAEDEVRREVLAEAVRRAGYEA